VTARSAGQAITIFTGHSQAASRTAVPLGVGTLEPAHTKEGMIPNERKTSEMSVVLVATALPLPVHRAEVIAACQAAITRIHDEPGIELYALHEGPDRLVMIEKYESEQALSEHSNSAALADLLSALEGKLSRDLDVQALLPHPTGNAQKGAL
jgi:quinol monooxygenase YgiN